MQFTILQENLKQGLTTVSHIAGKNINLPILSNIKIETKDKGIFLTSTNLEIGIVYALRGKIEKEGSFTVDAKIINDYIGLLPNKKTTIKREGNNLIIECENYNTKINGQADEDYPLIPSVNKDIYCSADIDTFKKALGQVVFAVLNSETRLELSGVLFQFEGDTLTLAATDSYRLAEKIVKIKNQVEKKQSIIVPAKTLHEVIRILSNLKNEGDVDGDNEIRFYVSDNQILFEAKNTEIVSKLIEGQYPDYKQIIPKNNQTDIMVNRLEAVRAIKASSLFSKTGINDVNLDFPGGKNQMVVSSTSGQTGESVIEVEAKTSGRDNGIVVNHHYLLDGLNNIDEENVKIEVTDNNTPCVLKPEKQEGYLYIIMPIKQ